MSLWLGYIVNFVITVVVAVAIFSVWVANRKRIAAETIGHAEEQALRIIRDAERENETKKKEALLEAKEKAHDLLVAADRQARDQERRTTDATQALARQEASLSDRIAGVDRREKDLQGQTQALAERDRQTAQNAARYEELVKAQQ